MEITNGAVCEWFVSPNFLLQALRRITAHGSLVLCVVKDNTGTIKNGFVVYYKNPVKPEPHRDCDGAPDGEHSQECGEGT